MGNSGCCLPLPLRCQDIFEPLIGHEVHPAGWNIWSGKQRQTQRMQRLCQGLSQVKPQYSAGREGKFCQVTVSRILKMAHKFALGLASPFSRTVHHQRRQALEYPLAGAGGVRSHALLLSLWSSSGHPAGNGMLDLTDLWSDPAGL